MGSHYGFIREQLTAGTDFAISVGAGGTTTTGGTLWLALYSENRQGLNLASALTQVTWVAGQKVTITINASARATGEEPFRYTLAGAATNTPANLQQLAFVWAIDPTDQITPEALPLTLELARDQDFVLGGSVAAAANLPTSPLDGAMRSAIAEGLRYEANGGIWTATTKPFSTYLTSTIEANGARVGCDRPLNQLSTAAIIQPLPYTPDGSLQAFPVRLDYSNGLAATAGPVLRKGTSMVFQLFVAGQDVSTRFSGKFLVTFLGYVNRATGALNTALSGVGAAIPYEFFLSGSGQLVGSNILLPADLDRGEAAAYKVALRVNADELNATGEPIADNSEVEILLSPVAPRGFYDSAYSLTGDLVYADEDNQFLRVVPDPAGVSRLGGSCTIARYTSPLVDAQLVGGFLADTADQQIVIDATIGAQATLRAPGAPLLSTEALRALVGTEPGSYTASAWSSPVALVAGQNLSISIAHPTAVRNNYPDVIAGMAAVFNAPRIRIFVRLSGIVYELPTPETTIPGGPANSVTVSDLSGWTSGATLPNSSGTPAFCAFGYSTLTATASGAGSSLSDGSYEVAVAWHYPSPNTRATAFDHSTDSGCIPEATATYSDLLSSAGKVAVSTVDTTPGYLYPKLVAGTGITLTKLNPGANEQIQIDGSLQLTIENEGTPLPQRNNLNFVGPAVTVTDSAPDTVVTVAPFQTFTGSPSAVTPTETGQLFVSTDTTPNLLYRSTGTGPGNLSPVGSYRTFTGDPTLVTPTHTGLLYIATDGNKLYRATGTTLGALVEVSAGGASGGGSDMTYTLTSSLTPASGEIRLSSVDTSDFGTAGGGFGDSIRISETDGNGVSVGYVLSTVVQAGYVKLVGQTSGAICYARVFSAVDSGTYRTWGVNLLTAGTGIFNLGETVSVRLLPGTLPLNTSKTANFSPGLNSERFFVNVSGGSVTATLPNTGSGPNYDDSLHYLFKVIPGNSNNTLTLARSGSDLIDGSTSVVLYQGESVMVHSDGQGNWYTTGRGQRLVQLQDEGVNQGTAGQATTYNITGEGASVSVSGGVATINIPGGGGLTPVYVTAPTVSGVKGNLYQVAGTTTLNLPAGVNGDQIAIVDQLPNFTAAPLTINPSGVQTIAGQSSLVLDHDNACVWLAFYGTNWAIVAAESFTDYSAGGGSASLTSFNTIAVSGQSNIVADSANDTVTFVAGSGISLTTNAATDALTISSTGPLTRTGVYREIWIGAGAMTPRTTNGAAVATVETATNDITYDVLDFDATTSEGVCFQISMPDSWDRGTIKARFYWTATSGSGTVIWAIKGGSLSDDDLLDTAYGTAQSVTDTLLATTDLHVTTATPALTVAGSPALQDWVYFEVSRDIADTLAVDARLIGVKIQYLELTTEPTGW